MFDEQFEDSASVAAGGVVGLGIGLALLFLVGKVLHRFSPNLQEYPTKEQVEEERRKAQEIWDGLALIGQDRVRSAPVLGVSDKEAWDALMSRARIVAAKASAAKKPARRRSTAAA